jgi:G:T-mismatch repair DNA endonuclease (very short patch repair protein)
LQWGAETDFGTHLEGARGVLNAKFERNIQRDAEKAHALSQAGWRVLTIWERETRTRETLLAQLSREFLD